MTSKSSGAANGIRFALFLRPFSSNRRLTIGNPYRTLSYLWPASMSEEENIDLETLLADAFRADGLICLGKHGEAIGAGRIEVSDSEWQADVKKLVARAAVVLVVPSTSEGTMWEINYLKENGHLPKSIFVMPPKADPGFEISWHGMVGHLPIWVPVYSRSGMLYKVDANGKMLLSVDLKVRTTRALALELGRLLPDGDKDLVRYGVADQPAVKALGFGIGYFLLPILLVPLILLILFLFR
jgi:hypothetical protein